MNLILLFFVLVSVGILCLYQLYYVMTNTTTIESFEKEKVVSLVERGKLKHAQFPFDLGVLENVYSVFGRNVFLWLLPMGARGDGLSFSIRLDLQGVSFLT